MEYRVPAAGERIRCVSCLEDVPPAPTRSVVFPVALSGLIPARKAPAVNRVGLCPPCYATLLERSANMDPAELRKERARNGGRP